MMYLPTTPEDAIRVLEQMLAEPIAPDGIPALFQHGEFSWLTMRVHFDPRMARQLAEVLLTCYRQRNQRPSAILDRGTAAEFSTAPAKVNDGKEA